jgi:hypothetical protein
MHRFLRNRWPALRLAPWLQINGAHPPQTLSQHLIAESDTLICTARSTLNLPELAGARTEHLPAFPNFTRLSQGRPPEDARFTVTYLGTINGAKMHPGFVAMSAAVEVPGIRILVHGAGGGEEALAAQIAESADPERFELGGYVENIGAVLAETHVFGYPLKRQTYATTEKSLIEAMAAGVCPVVFPHGGVTEIVNDGETGLIVQNEAVYGRAIRWLHDHPDERSRLGAAAQKSIRARFDPKALAARFLSIVDDVATRPRRALGVHGRRGEPTAADAFVEGLGRGGDVFERSRSDDPDIAVAADREIAANHDHLGTAEGGIIQHRNAAPDDPWLRHWSGLVLVGAGRRDDANGEFAAAVALDPTIGARTNRGTRYQQRERAFAMNIDDDVVVVDRFGAKTFTLNDVGGLLWNHTDEPRTADDMVAFLKGRWPRVDEARLRADVDAFVAGALEAGIIVPVES